MDSGVLQVEGDGRCRTAGVNIHHHWVAGKIQAEFTREGDALLIFLSRSRHCRPLCDQQCTYRT